MTKSEIIDLQIKEFADLVKPILSDMLHIIQEGNTLVENLDRLNISSEEQEQKLLSNFNDKEIELYNQIMEELNK